MQYRIDPKNGNRLSALGLGCMRFPGFALGRPDASAAERIIAAALDEGVNYLDTAYLYPGIEEVTGAALERLGARDWVFLATKLPHSQCARPEDFGRFFSEQLRRLRTDRVDYYLVHNVTSPAQWERLVDLGIEEWIAACKAAGRIGSIGFSFHGSGVDFPVLLDAYDWDFCQIQYNYVNEHYQAGTAGLRAAASRGMAVMVMEPLLGGKLAGKLPPEAKELFARGGGEGAPVDVPPAEWALRWVWDHPEVTLVLSGMTSPEQVAENARVAAVALPGTMTDRELAVVAQVKEAFDRFNRVPCTRCNYCMPCPRNVNIPGSFSAYNASFAHGRFTGIQQYMTASSALTGEPRLVTNCVGCGACAQRCPQHIDIPARLKDARRRLQPAPMSLALKLMNRKRP